jgi:hypothetical protein
LGIEIWRLLTECFSKAIKQKDFKAS